MNSRDDLSKEGPGLGFSKPSPGPDVRVEIGETGWEEEVGLSVSDNDFVNGVDVGMAVNPEMG